MELLNVLTTTYVRASSLRTIRIPLRLQGEGNHSLASPQGTPPRSSTPSVPRGPSPNSGFRRPSVTASVEFFLEGRQAIKNTGGSRHEAGSSRCFHGEHGGGGVPGREAHSSHTGLARVPTEG